MRTKGSQAELAIRRHEFTGINGDDVLVVFEGHEKEPFWRPTRGTISRSVVVWIGTSFEELLRDTNGIEHRTFMTTTGEFDRYTLWAAQTEERRIAHHGWSRTF